MLGYDKLCFMLGKTVQQIKDRIKTKIMEELKKIYNKYVEKRIVIPKDISTIEKVKMVKDYAELLDQLQNEMNLKLKDMKSEIDNFDEVKSHAETLIRMYHNKYGYEIK